jgi:hypothetical protein
MTVLAIAILLAGLIAGVISMVSGIDQGARGGERVKYLNLPTFAAAATVFGVVSYPLINYTRLGATAIVLIAVAAAGAAAAGVVAIIAGWAVPAEAKVVKDPRYDLQGQFARVTRPIGPQASGEVEFRQDETPKRAPARSLDGAAIELGVEVVIERIEDGIAHVERWSTIAQQLELPT